jgi:uncharacterized Zn finger protein
VEALDGNALAGALFEYFGTEMTTARCTCAPCGASRQIAELRVYGRAPGTVVRCASCGAVLIVLARIRGALQVTLNGLQLERSASEQ